MLLKNFKQDEFRCRCGCSGLAPAPLPYTDLALLNALEIIREKVGRPVLINSGYRCPAYNKKVSGADSSYHTKGMAADIHCRGMTAVELYDVIVKLFPDQYGVGLYPTFVHFDVRKNKTRFKG